MLSIHCDRQEDLTWVIVLLYMNITVYGQVLHIHELVDECIFTYCNNHLKRSKQVQSYTIIVEFSRNLDQIILFACQCTTLRLFLISILIMCSSAKNSKEIDSIYHGHDSNPSPLQLRWTLYD